MLPAGRAACHIDQCFPSFSSVLQQMLSWYPKSTLHCLFPVRQSPQFSPKLSPSPRSKLSHCFPPEIKFIPKCSTSVLCCIFPTVHFRPLNFFLANPFYFDTRLPLGALQAVRSWVRIEFRPHYDPGFDSASNGNEYQEYFIGGKGGRCVELTTLLPVLKPGNLSLLEPSGSAQACTAIPLPAYLYRKDLRIYNV